MTPNEAKQKLKDDKEFLVGSLVALYRLQVPDERAGKTTAHINNAGFNKVDAGILSDVSEKYLDKGYLTDKQLNMIRPKVAKYARQIADINPTPMKIGKRRDASPPKKKKKEATIYDTEKTKIKLEFPYNQELVNYVKEINGRKFVPDGKFWTVPMTITNVDRAIEQGFQLSEELNKWYVDQVNGVHSDISVPGLDDTLRPFQKEAVSYIESRNGRVLVADDMGLGKTLEAIAWIQLRGKEVLPAVIVCPATLKLNWLKEINKFTDLGQYVEVVEGFYHYPVTKPIIVVNYDILPQKSNKVATENGKKIDKPVPGTGWADYLLKNLKPKLIVADEVHKAKNRDAKRTKALGHLAKYTQYFVGLTGTPVDNRPVEIFQPIKMIKPTLFPNFKAFANRYCNPKFNGFGVDYRGASNTIELNQILTREVMLRRKKEDVLKDLPDKSRVVMPMEIDNFSEYRSARDDLIRYLRSIDIEKAKRASRAQTLAKIATLRRLAVKGKMKQSIEWIEDFIETNKLVVFTHHQDTAQQIMDKFKKNAVKIVGGMSNKARQDAEYKFQNREDTKILVGNMTATGEGRTLTAAHNVAFIEHPRTPGGLIQCEDRVHRIGQDMPVTCWNLVAHQTIDEDIVESLESKAQVVSAVTDGVDASEEGAIFDNMIDKLASA